AGEAHQPRIPRALVPDAPPRARRVAERVDRAHLLGERHPRLEHGRSVHHAAAPEARRVVHRDGARPRLPHRRGRPLMALRSVRGRVVGGGALWTVGLFAIVTILLTFSTTAMRSVAVIHRHSVA